ncbi:MAG TPA: PaaI family thioesterase [Roseateles sp.]|uniref:PaaI family thioesterase n=1 Tax=Roseateles sp. TaxID=1971397 RepID=UPI002ED7B8D0
MTPEAFVRRGAEILAAQPFSRLLGVEIGAVAPGRVELRLAMNPQLLQQHGFAHGGVLSYLADNALTFAGGTAMSSDALTSEYKINYLRPAVGELLIARAEAVNAGRTQAVCRCDVFAVKDGIEKLCAVAQGTIVKLVQD